MVASPPSLDRPTLVRVLPVLIPAITMGALAVIVAARTPLWRDELATLSFASLSLPTLFQAVSHVDSVLAPYYLLIHAVHTIVPGDFGLRLPSVLAAMVTVTAVSLLARRWWGGFAGFVSGLAIALNPLTVLLAATARPYALATCFLALAVLALASATERERPASWIAYAASLAAAGLMHFFALLTIPALLVLAVGTRRRVVAWCIATGAAVAVVAPVVLLAFQQREQVAWIGRPDLRSGVGALASVIAYQVDGRLGPIEAVSLALVCVCTTVTVLLTARLASPGRGVEFQRLGFAVALFLVPWAFLLIYSLVFTPYLRTQYLAPTVIGMALVLGAGIARGWPPSHVSGSLGRPLAFTAITAALATIVVSGSITAVVAAKPWRIDDYPGLVARLSMEVEEGDTLLVVQLYNEVGVAAGVARLLDDPVFIVDLAEQLPTGSQPVLNLRTISSTDPFETSAANNAAPGTLWMVYTRGAFSAEEFAKSGAAEVGCEGGEFEEIGSYGILRLARAECEGQ